MNATCPECRGPMDPDERCGACGWSSSFVDRELARLRDEMVRSRAPEAPVDGLTPPSGSGLGTREVPALATSEAGHPGSIGKSPVPSESVWDPAVPPPGAPRGDAPDATADGQAGAATAPRDGASVVDTDSNAPEPVQRGRAQRRTRNPVGSTAAGLRARELDVTTPEGAREALAEVLDHRRRGRGKIIGVAGLPRHGKTKLADRLRERAVERPGVDLRYDKTSRGRVNIYYVPGRRDHHVLIDVAGEDFQLLGDYSRELPALMSRFLWPVLQRIDGLLLLLALPIVWSGWNRPDLDQVQDPEPGTRDEMRQASAAMIDAHRTLLKYTVVARSLRRAPALARRFGIRSDQAPSRRQVDDVYQAAPRLTAPVLLGFSKADLYASGEGRSGLYAPPPPGFEHGGPPLHPLRTDPLAVARVHFPELFEFLLARVRYFKFDFVQALEDDTERPDPNEARVPDAPIESLLGGESALAFLAGHPWRLPGISTRTALRLDRWLRRGRWESTALEALAGTDPRVDP